MTNSKGTKDKGMTKWEMTKGADEMREGEEIFSRNKAEQSGTVEMAGFLGD